MTTKPKAPRFRLRREAPEPAAPAAADESMFEPADDGFGARVFPTAAAAQSGTAGGSAKAAMSAPAPAQDPAPSPSPETDEERELAAIKAEGLTGRQLRMARRVAQRHGLSAKSDFDAVRQLRGKGIDPFKHGNLLELVVGETKPAQDADAGAEPKAEAPGKTGEVKLPQTVDRARTLPAAGLDADGRRASEIVRMQRDMARRRQRRLALMFARVFAFVLLPTALAGYYFYEIATPMYATKSEFVIQQANPRGSSSVSSLFSGTAMATAQDSITVQSYLQSREAMLRLEDDLGFKSHFSAPEIDPIQRLEPGATNEAAYKTYSRNVKISYDPTEGIIKMEVIAPDPQLSAAFSRALISYAEEQVDHLTQRLREDQMSGAREVYEKAETDVLAAQQRVIDLQEQRGIVSGEAELNLLMSQITSFETELRREELALEELMENPSPNATRVSVTERNIERLKSVVADLRSTLTNNEGETESLARINGEMLIAQSNLETRHLLLAQALQQMETARIEANRQVRYLSTGVSPVAPDQATYPRAFESTGVTFLILMGTYLLMSLTVSILREQVSA